MPANGKSPRRSRLRTADFACYFVRYRDFAGQHCEEFALASQAMFRFEQLERMPGIRDLSWSTARGYVFASAHASQGSLAL